MTARFFIQVKGRASINSLWSTVNQYLHEKFSED